MLFFLLLFMLFEYVSVHNITLNCTLWLFGFYGEQKNSIAAIRSKHSLNFRIVSYLEAGSKWMDINIATIFEVSVYPYYNNWKNKSKKTHTKS